MPTESTPTGTTPAIAIDEDFKSIDIALRISLCNFERLHTYSRFQNNQMA